jgi:hypothetical protein
MKDWKTTTAGIVSAFFTFVLFKPDYFPPIMFDLAAFALVGGLAALGITARDFRKQ